MRSDESEFITYEMGTMLIPAALISSVVAPERSMSSNLFLRLTDSANAAFSSLREANCLIGSGLLPVALPRSGGSVTFGACKRGRQPKKSPVHHWDARGIYLPSSLSFGGLGDVIT